MCLAGDASPEQLAQAVAEQISQQARQQMSEAGSEAPVPLLTALRNYLQRLDSMSQGDLSVRVFNLPPSGPAAGVRRQSGANITCLLSLWISKCCSPVVLKRATGACSCDDPIHPNLSSDFVSLCRQQCSVQSAADCSCCTRVHW